MANPPMAYPSVISDRARRRKRRQRKWAIVRGLITFVVAFAVLLLSAWLGGDLRGRDHHPAQEAAAPSQPVLAEPLAAPAQQTLAWPIHRAKLRAEDLSPTIQRADEPEVLSTDELAAISQAHQVRPAP